MKKSLLKYLYTICFFLIIIGKSNGQTYTSIVNMPSFAVNDYATTDGKIFAVCNAGKLYTSLFENSSSLFSSPSNTFVNAGNLKGIRFLNNSTGYIWTNNGSMFKTTNAGINWEPIVTNITDSIIECSFIDETHFYILSDDKIYKTDNSGSTWTLLNSPSDINFKCIYFVNNSVGFSFTKMQPISPYRSKLYKTEDGGSSWTEVMHKDSVEFFQLVFINNTGYLSFNNSSTNPNWMFFNKTKTGIFKTTDLGNLWNILRDINQLPPVAIEEICFNKNNSVLWLINDYNSSLRCYLELYDGVSIGPQFISPYGGTNVTSGKLLRRSVGNVPYCYLIIHSSSYYSLYRFSYEPVLYKELTFYNNPTTTINFNSSNPLNILEPSRRVRFKVNVQNKLTSNLLTLSGKLHTNSPYLTITDSIVTYNNIVAGAQGCSADEFEIELSPYIPNNHLAYMTLELNDQIVTGGPWETYFEIPFVFNPFDVSNNIIDDDDIPDSNGNNNDIAEASETIEIIPLMDNTTTHTFSNIEGYLFSPYSQINIWNNIMGSTETVYNHYSYGTLNVGTTNKPPAKDFVFTNGFNTTYSLPFDMVMTGNISSFNGSTKYQNILFRWAASFVMNSGYPNSPYAGVTENLSNDKIVIYPNPAKERLIFNSIDEKIESIEIIDILGNSVYFKYCSSFNETVDISDYSSGVFTIKTSTKNKTTIRKIVFE